MGSDQDSNGEYDPRMTKGPVDESMYPINKDNLDPPAFLDEQPNRSHEVHEIESAQRPSNAAVFKAEAGHNDLSGLVNIAKHKKSRTSK